MRWSSIPVSVAAHIAAALLFLIVPLAADVDVPPIARVRTPLTFMPAAAVPETPVVVPVRSRAPQVRPDDAAPTRAPDRILPEEPFTPPDPGIEGALPPDMGIEAGPPGGALGDGAGTRVTLPEPLPAPDHPLRVGGRIREPKKLSAVPPVYPPIARAARVQGLVVLEAVIDERGVVTGMRVIKSVPLLDDAALQAVRQWRYTPTLLNGVPVSVLMTIRIDFTLE